MIGTNSSYSCIYPLVQKELNLSMAEYVTDTYIYNTTYEDCYSISYHFEEKKGILTPGLFELLHRKYEKSDLLLETLYSDTEDKLCCTIKRPETLTEAFNHFEKGQYSQFTKRQKFIIVNFINKHFSRVSTNKRDEITAILFKDPEYRDWLSKKLNYKFKESDELGSLPVIYDEVFDPSMINAGEYAI